MGISLLLRKRKASSSQSKGYHYLCQSAACSWSTNSAEFLGSLVLVAQLFFPLQSLLPLEMASSSIRTYTCFHLQITVSPEVPSCVSNFTWCSTIKHCQFLKALICILVGCNRTDINFGNCYLLLIFLQISHPHVGEKSLNHSKVQWGTESRKQPNLKIKYVNLSRDFTTHDCNTELKIDQRLEERKQ